MATTGILRDLSVTDTTCATLRSTDQSIPRVRSDSGRALIAETHASFRRYEHRRIDAVLERRRCRGAIGSRTHTTPVRPLGLVPRLAPVRQRGMLRWARVEHRGARRGQIGDHPRPWERDPWSPLKRRRATLYSGGRVPRLPGTRYPTYAFPRRNPLLAIFGVEAGGGGDGAREFPVLRAEGVKDVGEVD